MLDLIRALVKLVAVEQFGPAKSRKIFQKLAEENVRLEWLSDYEISDLIDLGLTDGQADDFVNRVLSDSELHLIELMLESNVGLVTFTDDDIPAGLKRPQLAPWYFYLGNLDALSEPTLGFSGSRDASPDALEVTSLVADAAVENGLTVITGGARGVDQAGHAAALEAGGASVLLLAQGIGNVNVASDSDNDQILVLSEFLPWEEWSSFRAMQRNKSIVNLSDCMVIPQAGIKGGTMNAAEYALKQNRNLWVADLGEDYPGNQLLLQRGARPIPWVNGVPDIAQMRQAEASRPTQQTLF